ncbi:MAG: hypothetical protein IPM82_12975 [Saprospiraceae bacterium]|nr:hypothetical protein [Saprospiraceae bacterium]
MNSSNHNISKPLKLEEGIDFTIENGLYVFTAEYLRKRGYCCESGCRNCPYGFKKTKNSGQN